MEENNAVLNTIQIMTNRIFNSIDDNLVGVLDRLVFLDNNVFIDNSMAIHIYKIASTMKVIAESILIGYVIYYLIRYLISRITMTSKEDLENPLTFFTKVILCGIAMYNSGEICKFLINLNSNISTDLFENMIGITGIPGFKIFLNTINRSLLGGQDSFDIFSIDGIFKGFISFGTLNMTISFAMRYILIRALVIIAPVAFVFKTYSKTEKYFDMWLKAFISLLLVQHFITVLLMIGGMLKDIHLDTLNKIAYIGLIYALSKSFTIFEKLFGGFAPDAQVSFPFK